MIAIQIGNGGQDAQGSERGREYDTVSGTYTQFVEREVLPLVEQQTGAKLTKNPDGRPTMGLSSSGAAAFTMAWFHPALYRRVLAYSPTMVNQQWPYDLSLRGGAWEYHSPWAGPSGPNLTIKAGVISPSEPPGSPLITSAPTKPIRYWFAMGDQDLFYPNPVMADGMHDWVLPAERMAKVLADKGYHYQFVFARNSKHVDRPPLPKPFRPRSNGYGRAIRFRSEDEEMVPLAYPRSGTSSVSWRPANPLRSLTRAAPPLLARPLALPGQRSAAGLAPSSRAR